MFFFTQVSAVLCCCFSTIFATYGPEYNNNGFKPIYNTPKHHYDSSSHEFETSKHHYDASKHHYEAPKHHYDAPKHHYDAPKHHYDAPKHHYDAAKVKVDEPKIHVESPKIILDRPSINVHGGHHSPLLDDEPIILENDKPLYIRKTLHGIPAAPTVTRAHSAPVLVDSSYSSGKVLDITGKIYVLIT